MVTPVDGFRERFLAPRPRGTVLPGPLPSFSVVIAAHDVADVIGDAIESVLAQTLPPIEIVVCDDGSRDDLDAALAHYRGSIHLVRKERGGEASAKNAAAKAASGDFVAILDADDVFLPRRLEALAELAATRPDLDILTTDAYLTVAGRRLRRCYEGGWTFAVDDQPREILRRNFIFGLVAVRRELLLSDGGFDESILWTTDWDRWLRLIHAGSRAGAVMDPLALYRLRESSLSSRRDDLVRGKIETLEKARRSLRLESDEPEVLERALAGYRRELRVEELRAALIDDRPEARREGLRVALGRGMPVRVRAEALAAALAPALTGRVERARAERFWTGAGGIRVDRRELLAAGAGSQREPGG